MEVYSSFVRLDVFVHLYATKERPKIPLRREEVRAMLVGLVPRIAEDMIPWCAYIATQSGLCDIEDGLLIAPDDFIGMGRYVDAYEVVEQVIVEELQPLYVSGNLTTRGQGEVAIEMGGLEFYRTGVCVPPDMQVIEWYFEMLEQKSKDIPPMRANYDSPFEMGRALQRGRVQQALEIVGALKEIGKPLYIPGDGIGCFSYAAMKLGVPFMSHENGGVGQIARDIGLIRGKECYSAAAYDVVDCILVASNLMPFCPELLQWPGSMVVYDAQCFWHNHPDRLRYIQDTGYRLYATEDLRMKLIPRATRRKMLPSDSHVQRWIQELEANSCEAFMTDDKHSLVMLMEARIPVVSNLFADTGHPSWRIQAPRPDVVYLKVGETSGVYGLSWCNDHNTTKIGPMTSTFVYGRNGVMIYGALEELRNQGCAFAPKMLFRGEKSLQKIYGKTRSFHHYRLEPYVTDEGVTRMAFKSKVAPPPNVVCLFGRRVISCIVKHTEVRGTVFFNLVEPGPDVASIVNRDVWRHESELEWRVKVGDLPTECNKRRQYTWSRLDKV